MYLAGVSVRRVEDITEALWGTRVSPSTVSNSGCGLAAINYDQSILLGGERASPLYGRGIAKLRKGGANEGNKDIVNEGNKDIVAASRKQPGIAEEYQGYGVSSPNNY
jgi:hypothetical protein